MDCRLTQSDGRESKCEGRQLQDSKEGFNKHLLSAYCVQNASVPWAREDSLP